MKSPITHSPRYLWLDLTRFLAITMVVALHTTDYFVRSGNYSRGGAWWIAASINLGSIVAVPWFLLISGMLLYKPSSGLHFSTVIHKTITRLAIPFVAWASILYLWQSLIWSHEVNLKKILTDIYLVDMYHLYYLLVLIGLYLWLPVITVVLSKLSLNQRILVWMFLAAGAIGIKYAAEQDLIVLTVFSTWALYLPYFIAGMLLRAHSTRASIKLASIAACISMLIWILNLIMFTSHFEIWQLIFSNYLTIGGMSLGLTSFLCLYHLRDYLNKLADIPLLATIITQLGIGSYGVYLVHPIVMDILDRFAGMNIHTYPGHLAIYTLHFLGLVIVCSYAVIIIARQIPPLRLILGEPWKKPKSAP